MDSQTTTAREIVWYEYRFETTSNYTVVSEEWELFDVFLKQFEYGGPIIKVVVFRKVTKRAMPY